MLNSIPSFVTPEIILTFVLGMVFGSFGNVLIARLPKRKPITGRSQCPYCKRTLFPIELIPLISLLFLQGKCRGCKKSISLQYPMVELAGGLLFLLAGFLVGWDLVQTSLLALSLWLLLLIAIIDARTQKISDALNIPLLCTAAAYSVAAQNFDPYALAIGVGFLGFQWILSRGSWVGTGDMILIISISLLVGSWPIMLFALFAAYIFGGTTAAMLLFSKRKTRTDSLAFAPFLAMGLLVSLLVGNQTLWRFYGI